mmetsp:Transcript_413/g.980  ORF Transcript_413/g.980 Transcript_413/m.980 type:complete len:186 (-) Transcript_413:774-1331(-)
MILHMDADGRICGNHGGSGGFDAALSSDSVTDPPAPLVIACRAGANGLSQGVRHGHALSLRMPRRGSSRDGDHLVEGLCGALGCLSLGRCLWRGHGQAVGLGLAHSGRATPGPRSTACGRLAMGLESHDCGCGLPLPGQRKPMTTGFGSTSAESTSRQTRHRAERAITRGVANTTRSSSGSSSSG